MRVQTSQIGTYSVPTPSALATALAGPTTATGRALAATLLTSSTGVFSYIDINPSNQGEYLVKIDYNLNEKNQINGHSAHDSYSNVGNPTNYITYQRLIPGLVSSVQWTHTFNSKTVNTVIGSFSGNTISETNGIGPNVQFGKPVLRPQYGLTYATLYGASVSIPQISVTGYTLPSTTPPAYNNYSRVYAGKDDFSRIIGNHSLKAGAYVGRARKNQTAPPALNGQFTFPSLASLVQASFSAYTEGSNTPQVQARFTQAESYVQDDWTVTRRLTVNAGLRWQDVPPIYSWGNTSQALTRGSMIRPTPPR